MFKNHNMALYKPHLKAVSDSASLKEVSKLSQKLELKLTDDQCGPSVMWLLICECHFFPCIITMKVTGFSLRFLVAGERCNVTREYFERGSSSE